MWAFSPSQEQLSLQAPTGRAPIVLRFSQFQSLLLEDPVPAHDGVPHTAGNGEALPLACQALLSPYHVQLIGGETLEGQTVGHVSTAFGLFLFLPVQGQGTLQRCFFPRAAVLRWQVGDESLTYANDLGAGEGDLKVSVTLPDDDLQASDAKPAPVGLADGPDGPAFRPDGFDAAELQLQPLDFALDPADLEGVKERIEAQLATKVATPLNLVLALDQQSKKPMVRIGDTLVNMGLITPAQLATALEEQALDRTVPLGEVLVRKKVITRKSLLHALARKMGYPLVDLNAFPIDPDALVKVPFHAAMRMQLIPLMVRDGALIVAMEDPSRRTVLAELEFSTQCKVVPVLVEPGEIEPTLREAYAKLGAEMSTEISSSFVEPDPELDSVNSGKLVEDLEKAGTEADDEEQPLEQSDNSLVRLVNTMVIEAYTQGVSDIHVECYPGRQKVKIRFRKDGALMSYLELPHNYRSALIARIKIMCDLDISERRRPQDGKINFARFVPQYRLELRVATIPTAHGLEDVVMRILSSARPLPLDKIGLSARNLGMVTEALLRPYGMILCVGPTGSGKTTALHSALGYINVAERKIWTAEDPVEITQPGLRQVQINPKLDWTFAKALRAFLRADPDVIMVGEMRDAETASMGIEASLTGHLVLSTLHTNSAPETITRLLDMGMDPFNFADSLLLVMAMRLVKKHCTACRVAEPAPDDWLNDVIAEYQYPWTHMAQAGGERALPPEWQAEALRADWAARLGEGGQLMRYRSVGCAECRQTGYRGRSAIHEVLTVDREMRHLIQTGARAELLQQQAMRNGMRTLRQDGLEKMLSGVTSIEEVRANSNA